jgi:uncharacterized protein YbgA (DUF1722 family)
LVRKGITENKVTLMISQIKEEASHFNVDITDYFESQLHNLEKKEIQAFINEQRKYYNKDFSV